MEKKKKQKPEVLNIFKPGKFITKTPEETRELGELFAKKLKKGDVVFLKGDLGSGKTTFTQGIVKACGNEGFARSSSFILVNEYNAGNLKLFHLDLYRLSPATAWDLGIEEYIYGENIAIIEWPDRLIGCGADNTWDVEIKSSDGDDLSLRKISIKRKK